MTRFATTTTVIAILIVFALILVGCGGGDSRDSDATPEQIGVETIEPTDTVEPTPLPPTWTPVPTRTPAPPAPTITIRVRPTHTPFMLPIATPLLHDSGGETPPSDSLATEIVNLPGTAESGGAGTSPDPGRVDLAPLAAGNVAQIALIRAQENVFAADLAWSIKGRMLAVAMPDGVRLFANADLTTEPHVLPDAGTGTGFQVEAVAFSPDGSRLASGNTNGELVIWDTATYERLFTIQAHDSTLWDVIFSPDGSRIVTGGEPGWIKVWDARSGELVREIETGDVVVDLAVYPLSGLVVASGTSSSRAKVWNLTTDDELATLTGHSSETRAVAFSPDGETLASGGAEGSVRLWTVAGAQAGDPEAVLGGHTNRITVLAYSPDSRLMAVGVSDGRLAVWNLSSGEKLFETQAHIPWVSAIVWLPDQTALLTTGRDGAVRLWGVPAN